MCCNEWAQRYEDLRQRALSERQAAGHNWGMALFLRNGLAGWIRAWPKPDPAAQAEHPRCSTSMTPPPSLPASMREQITILLANMILNGHKEARL